VSEELEMGDDSMGVARREDIHTLVDALREQDLPAVKKFIEFVLYTRSEPATGV
jgi:hypothetical protein